MKITAGMVKQAAIDLVLQTKEHFKTLRKDSKIERGWELVEKTYFSSFDNPTFTAGLLFTRVERIVPKLDKAVFPPDGEFFEARAKDRKNEIQEQAAERATNLLLQQFREIGLREKLIPAYRELAIYGTVFIKYFWNRIERPVYRKNEKGERVKIYDLEYDNPDFYVPSIWNIYIDPKDDALDGALIEEAESEYFELYRLRKQEDEDGEEYGIYDPKEVLSLKDSKVAHSPDPNKQSSDITKQIDRSISGPHENKVIVNHYWGPVPKWILSKKQEDKESGDVCEDAYIVVAQSGDKTALLRVDDNPFDHQRKPFLKANYIKTQGKAYGIGVINPFSIKLSEAYDTTMYQGIRNRSFNLKPKWKRLREANIHSDQLTDIENAVIDTDDMNGLEPLQTIDMTATVAAHASIFKTDSDEVSGALPFLAGIPAGRSLERTAEGVATMTQGGLERFELVITAFEQEMLLPLIRGFWSLDQQFLPSGRDIQEAGDRIVRVLPQMIALNNFDLIFSGIRDIADKNFKVGAINILMQSPLIQLMVQSGQLNAKPLAFRLIKLLGQGDVLPEMDVSQENMLEQTPEGEVQLLLAGRIPKIDIDDYHEAFIQAYQQLLQNPQLPQHIRFNTEQVLTKRLKIMELTRLATQREQEIGRNRNAI